jgi:hypothetical protein
MNITIYFAAVIIGNKQSANGNQQFKLQIAYRKLSIVNHVNTSRKFS